MISGSVDGKDAKISKFTVRKACCGKQAKGVAEEPFSSAVKGSKPQV